MAVLAPPTLAEIRREVFARVGYAQSGNQTVNTIGQLDSLIRQAHRELYVKFPWTVLKTRTTIVLADGVSSYDWPDDTEPGQILSMSAVNTGDNRMYDVVSGARPNERDSAAYGTGKGRPLVADYSDGMIELFPSPDVTNGKWGKLEIEYLAGCSPLNDDEVRASIDGEAVIQRATLLFKDELGIPVSQIAVEAAKSYLEDLRSLQSSGEGLQLGGHQSWRCRVQKRNRVGDARNRYGNGAPFSNDWNPW